MDKKNIITERSLVTMNRHWDGLEGSYILRLKNEFIASSFKPGQFIMLKANPGCKDPLLSRPFSILRRAGESEFEVLYRIAGRGTKMLSRMVEGEYVYVTGPLGNGFTFNGGDKTSIVIAGGIGIAPVYSIPSNIKNINNGRTILFYGSRTASELYFKENTGEAFGEVNFATDDGSLGFKGNVTDLLEKSLKDYSEDIKMGSDISFYSCGPKPMLDSLVSVFNNYGLAERLQVSLEENFGCGIGVCLGCAVKIKENSGNTSDFEFKRVCKDGPVFYADSLYGCGKSEKEAPVKVSVQAEKSEAEINLSVKIGELKLDYPVMPASGTFGYGEEFAGLTGYESFGALVSKGISLTPSKGNDMPRIVETHCGLINSIGLQNVGLDVFLNEKLPFMRSFGKPVIVNFFGKSVEEYASLAEKLSMAEGVSAIEANISCPNIKEGGRSFGSDPEIVYELVSSVKESTKGRIPVIIKLTPMVSNICLIAEVCEKAGADIISLINTIPSAYIDIKTKKFKLGKGFGGLSGPAIKPVALKLVSDVYNCVRIPVIGMGGISSWEDAVEFFLAGASAVAVGTYAFINNNAIPEISAGIMEYLKNNGFNDVRQIIGLASRNL